MIFSGVLSISSMLLLYKSPAAVRIRLSTAIETTAVLTAVFITPYFFAPKLCDIITELPILLPTATAIKIITIGYDAPTAAKASSPTNFPAITLSAML